MLYFIYGSDVLKAIDKSKQLIDTMLEKKPNASHFRVNAENLNEAELQEFIGGQGLFENKYIVSMSRVFDEDSAEIILDYLPEIKESNNIFIWTEGEVNKTNVKKIEKYADKVQEFVQKETIAKPDFNIFSLGDFLGSRDKKKLWLNYLEAMNYFPVQEIHGTLFWQVKNILIAKKVKSVNESGLKPFVFNKAKGFAKNFSDSEIEDLSERLMKISHDSRRGLMDFEIAMEKFCLEV